MWCIIYVSQAWSWTTRVQQDHWDKINYDQPAVCATLRQSKAVGGIFNILWMTFSCWWGVSRSLLLHESTSLPCVTDLPLSPGLAQGEVCQAYLVLAMGHLSHGCVYVCYSPMVTALMSTCVNGENMHSIMPVHWEWAAVNSITHRVSICVGSLGVIFLSRWSIYVCPQVKIYCCIPHTHKHTHFLKLFKTCLHAGNNMFWYVAGALTNP